MWVVIIGCQSDETLDLNTPSATLVAEHFEEARKVLPFADSLDFENANRGFIGTRLNPVIKGDEGQVLIDLSAFVFLDLETSSTVHPSLWRQSQLNRIHGLFEVVDGIYQIRGFDLANMTLIRSDNGWIVVDPLTSTPTARAAWNLAMEHLDNLPITGIIFTHSHIDHFGGIRGILSQAEIDEKDIPVVAPEGFYDHGINENVLAGNAMTRRALYMFGSLLRKDTTGMVGNGLGQSVSAGNRGIQKPNVDIVETGQHLSIDGVEIVFQNTPGAEAPAECMFYLPQFRAFCQAEQINHNMHNLYTLRGAKVRNGLKWSKYIDESIQLFSDQVEVSFGSHHWPTWGRESILELWVKQRDLYRYIHDETLYMANMGYTMDEIAENIKLPSSLANFFANRGYYGTLKHNAKAQYQLYFGWFDGNPAHLDNLPLEEASRRYVEYMGGVDAVMEKVKTDIRNENFRWAATVLNHVVFAEPANTQARTLLAETYMQLGYLSESGPWRNFYLTGAKELINGIDKRVANRTTSQRSRDIITNLSLEMFYDYMAVRLDRKQAKGKQYEFNMIFPDIDEVISLQLINDVLHNRPGILAENPNATITMNKSIFDQIIMGETTGLRKVISGDINISGNRKEYQDFQNMIKTPFLLNFNIIEP